MRKYGEVLDYRTAGKAVIGKKYIFEDNLHLITERPNDVGTNGNLAGTHTDDSHPFEDGIDGYYWQFCREVIDEGIDEEELMTNRQLAEWLAKGNGEWSTIDNWLSDTRMYRKGKDGEAVPEGIRIRPWGSDEWVVPTVEIYERDCKGVK